MRVNVKICDDEVFIENSIFSRQHLKERIIKNKDTENKVFIVAVGGKQKTFNPKNFKNEEI